MSIGSPIQVLIVDDSSIIAKLITSVLNPDEFSVTTISDGKQAYEHLISTVNPPDVILLDYDLPSMNGIEIMRNLKESGRNYAIIFITADTSINTAVSVMKEGALDFFSKISHDIQEIPEKIHKVIELHTIRIQKKLYEEKLEELNRTKDLFFSLIAHDLRNPFGAIIGYCDVMKMENHEWNNEDILDFVQSVRNSSSRAYHLLENLLLWAKSQSGSLDFKPLPCDIRKLAAEAVSFTETQARNKNIQIEQNIESIRISADENMISTVLRNLITNAIKFTRSGGKIRLTSKKEGNFAEVSVEDNGIGMPPETVEKLFKIEVKHTTAGTNREPGSGLGLILCRDFIEKNHGSIRVESKTGQGSIFSFTIPLADG